MIYTVQTHTDSGNWVCPTGTESLTVVRSKREAANVLSDWADTVGRYDDRRCVSALVWMGELDDVTDKYPDFELTLGPRLGIVWNPC